MSKSVPFVVLGTANTREVSALFKSLGLPEFAIKRNKQKEFLSSMSSGKAARYMAVLGNTIDNKLKSGKKRGPQKESAVKKAVRASLHLAPTLAQLDYVSPAEIQRACQELARFSIHGEEIIRALKPE